MPAGIAGNFSGRQAASVGFVDQDEVVIQVGGEAALIRSLRALEKQRGDPVAKAMRQELAKAARDVTREVVVALRAAAPVGNYRKKKKGQRLAKKANTRKVQIGSYKGEQQPAGELRASISPVVRQGRREIEMGGTSAFYIRAVLAGHTLTRGGGVVRPNPFVWQVALDKRGDAEQKYQKALERAAKKFRAEHGRTTYTSASSGRRR